MRGKVMVGLAVAAIAAVVVVALAQPPPIPAVHPVPIDPEANAQGCFRCHAAPDLVPVDQRAFCETCHINVHFATVPDVPVARPAPDAAHPLEFTWTAKDCAACHRLQHNGMNPTHQIAADMPGASFCLPCHLTPQPAQAITGDESVEQFCAQCHHIGVVPPHPGVEEASGKNADFCLQCHTQE